MDRERQEGASIEAAVRGGTPRTHDRIRGTTGPHGTGGAPMPRSALLETTAQISNRLAQRLGDRAYDMWFGNAARLSVHDNRLEVATSSRFAAAWIDANFLADLGIVAREALGEGACVELRVAPDLFPGAPQEACQGSRGPEATGAPSGRPAPRRRSELRRLEDFVVGPTNCLAHAAARRLAEESSESPAAVGSPLLVYGECGVGKTHLLQGTARRHATRQGRGGAARYLTAEQFTNEFVAAVRASGLERFRRKMRGVELLSVDDVQFLANKTATQNEFLHTIDALTLAGARIVLAADQHPSRMPVPPALTSRFLAGTVARIACPDFQTRLGIIRHLASARGFGLTVSAAEAIAQRCSGSARDLEGALNRLSALRRVAGHAESEAGLVLVEQVLTEGEWQPQAPVRIDTVIDEVCGRLRVNRGQVMSGARDRRAVAARGLIAFLARDLTTLSFPEISAAFGRRNHSTIFTAAQRFQGLLESRAALKVGPNGAPVSVPDLVDELRHRILRLSMRSRPASWESPRAAP
jgi:chromosomal replication initiator protein